MLDRKTHWNKKDIILFVSILKQDSDINGKEFNFFKLYNSVMYEPKDEIYILDDIDNLMVELTRIYHNLKETDFNKTVDKLVDVFCEDNELFGDIFRKQLSSATKLIDDFNKAYEGILQEYKFYDSTIRGIQKTILSSLVNVYAKEEDYEKCIELKKNIELV